MLAMYGLSHTKDETVLHFSKNIDFSLETYVQNVEKPRLYQKCNHVLGATLHWKMISKI